MDHFGFGADKLEPIGLDGLRTSPLPPEDEARLEAELHAEFARLREGSLIRVTSALSLEEEASDEGWKSDSFVVAHTSAAHVRGTVQADGHASPNGYGHVQTHVRSHTLPHTHASATYAYPNPDTTHTDTHPHVYAHASAAHAYPNPDAPHADAHPHAAAQVAR